MNPSREFTSSDLRRLITVSGMTITRFAEDVAGADVRTVRRWLGGDEIPPARKDFLSRILYVRASEKAVALRVASKHSVGEILGVLRRG